MDAKRVCRQEVVQCALVCERCLRYAETDAGMADYWRDKASYWAERAEWWARELMWEMHPVTVSTVGVMS